MVLEKVTASYSELMIYSKKYVFGFCPQSLTKGLLKLVNSYVIRAQGAPFARMTQIWVSS